MSKLPSTGPSLLRHIRQQDRQALRQAQSSAFTRSGASVSNPGMLSSDDFDGVDRTHLGTSGWALGSVDGGPSYLALNGRDIFADLTAKDAALAAQQADLAAQLASINDLITKVVATQQVYFSATNFAVGTTPTNKAAQTITVPAGFTRAVVSVTSRVFVMNPNTTGGSDGVGGDFIAGVANVKGYYGWNLEFAILGSNGSCVLVCPFAKVLTGLTPGGTFVVSADASTSYLSMPANALNTAEVSGHILWYR